MTVPKLREELLGEHIDFRRNIGRIHQLFLMRSGLEIIGSNGNSNAECFDIVSSHPGSNTVCQCQEYLVSLFGGNDIFFQGGGNAVSLGFLRGSQNRGVIDSVGIVMDLLSHLNANDPLHTLQWCICHISNGSNSGLLKFLCSRCTDREQVPDGEGLHLLRDLMVVQGMYLIRFLEITGHLC